MGSYDICEFIWTFLEVPMDVNFTNFRGMTGLLCASKNGHSKIVEMLLHVPGIDVNARDKSGMSALLHATRRCNFETVNLLLEAKDIDVNCRDKSGWTPLMIASMKGQNIEPFLEQPNIDLNVKDKKKMCTALTLASRYGHPKVVHDLIHHENMDLSTLLKKGEYTQYDLALLHAYEKNSIEIISLLEEDEY